MMVLTYNKVLVFFSLLLTPSFGQQKGTFNTETPISFRFEEFNSDGQCQAQNGALVLDSNWRWTHKVNDYTNCYTGNEWDHGICSDVASCSQNCALEGIKQEEWAGTYGITGSEKEITMKFVTHGPFSTNIGSRVFLLDSSKQKYKKFYLLNKEISFDVDPSNLGCGLNGAVYLVEMDEDGGLSYEGNKVGAQYGTGYCDAQCPHDIKWINGEANILDWQPSPNDPNSGKGHYGTCCAEFDLWEANSLSQAFTSHPCDTSGQYRCENKDCGDNDSGDRYNGVCDKDGCDYANFRLGDPYFYGSGSSFKVDSSKKMTVITQFITDDGTDNGNLVEVKRLYKQNGQVVENGAAGYDDLAEFNSITDEFCLKSKDMFAELNAHADKGGLKAMGDAMKRGMVFTMSLWDDHEAFMLWLDSNYPLEADPGQPGVARGPCPTDSGRPEDVEAEQPDATVSYGNVRFGPIGSTF